MAPPVVQPLNQRIPVGRPANIGMANWKRVRRILNNLTPANFPHLQMSDIKTSNPTELTMLVGQVFEKALRAPDYGELYAELSKRLLNEQPEYLERDEDGNEVKVTFRRILLNKCQEVFEGCAENVDGSRAQVEEVNKILHQRYLANVRFIGELYRKGLLTDKIMHVCITKLLGGEHVPHEEDLEALCKLMSTIGKVIDHPKSKAQMDAYLRRMLQLSTEQLLPPRIRFALFDVVETRALGWPEQKRIDGPRGIEQNATGEHQIRPADGLVNQQRQEHGPGPSGLSPLGLGPSSIKQKKPRKRQQRRAPSALPPQLPPQRQGPPPFGFGGRYVSPSNAYQGSLNMFPRYTFDEICKATSNFAIANLLEEGSFGKVYSGVLNHTEVAIKLMTEEGFHGKEQFQREVEVHCRIRHPNIVMLLGTCTSTVFCLVYEFMPNGNLEDRLTRRGGSEPLTWQTRVRVAAEVAVALLYLHSARPAPIFHRHLKPANILLDQNLSSKLGDVGLAAVAPPFAPGSNPNDSPFYPASDVFSYGVVLLQLLTGRPPLGLRPALSIAVSSNDLGNVLDKTAGAWPPDVAAALARLALKCTEPGGAARPNLRSEVVPEMVGLRSQAVEVEARAAAGQAAEDTVPDKFICPISQDIMDEPVLAADGNHYDRKYIELWLQSNNTSPLTNLEFEHDKLNLDRSLLNEIREWREQHEDE